MGIDYREVGFGSESVGLPRLGASMMYSSPNPFQGVEHKMGPERRGELVDGGNLSRQLQHILQLLALPIRGQVRLVGDDCTRIRRLSSAFRAVHLRVRREWTMPMAADQMGALNRLYTHLEQISQDQALTLCSELAMRESIEWRRARLLARDALVRFGWDLELPSQDSASWELKLTAPSAS